MTTNAATKEIPWFLEIASEIQAITGVQLGMRQRTMVQTRLSRRMIELGIKDPMQYVEYFHQHREAEVRELVALLTTHHSFFFREFVHFTYLEETALPKIIAAKRKRGEKMITLWSAAASHGQEAYSLAIFMRQYLKTHAPEFDFTVFATDIDEECVKHGKNGVYKWAEIKEIPAVYLHGNWQRGTGDIQDFVKIKPELQNKVTFQVGNLTNIEPAILGKTFDIIFCRNVFIYFTPNQIGKSVATMSKHLGPEGYIFTGTSESLRGLAGELEMHAPSIWSRPQPSVKVVPSLLPNASVTKPTPVTKKKLRVLCVDDSASVLALLKKILVDDFEVVATATNGIEAAAAIAANKIDVVTLDIHMPVQDGVEYLRKNFKGGHPPVVIVSSVPREDSHIAMNCLALGACDYIEKPALNQLATRAEEIQTKLRCAAINQNKVKGDGISQAFAEVHTITSPDTKLRIIFGGVGSRNKIIDICQQLKNTQPPTVIFTQGSSGILNSMADQMSSQITRPVHVLEDGNTRLQAGSFYLADFATMFSKLSPDVLSRPTSVLALSDASKAMIDATTQLKDNHLMLEESPLAIDDKGMPREPNVKMITPHTSMAYHSCEFLAKGR